MIYLVGDKRYDIPQDENENFLSVNPDARAVVTASGKRFAIPQDKLTDFFAQYPDASYMDRESYDTYEAQIAQAAAPQGEPQAEPARRGAVRRFLDGLRHIPSQIAERNQVDTDQDDRLSLAQSFAAMGAYTAATGAGMGLGSPMTGVKQDGEPILSQETKEAIDQAEVESAIRHTERDINRRRFAAALHAVSDRFFLPPFTNAALGLYNSVADIRAWDLGINDILDGEAVLNTLQKQENGEPLTLEEELLLDALAEKAWLEENTEVGTAYAIGKGVGESLSYMIPIILSPASGAAKASAKLGVRLAVKARLGAGATRAAGIIFGTGGAAANAAVTELTSGAGGTYSEFLRRQMGDIRYEVTPEGYITFAGRDNVEDEHTAKRKALAKQFGEFFSEEFGAGFQLIGHGVGRGVGRMIGRERMEALRTLLNKVPRLVNRSSSSEMARFVDDIAEAGKFSGSLVEYLEEVSNTILDSFLTGDSSISDLLDARQQIETLGTVVGTSALFGSFKAGGDMRYKHRARESMKESDAFLSDQEQDAKKNFLKDYGGWASVRATINGEDTDAAYEMLARIATDKKMPVEVRAQVLNYFTSGLAVQGHTIADLKKATDRQLLQESYALSDAYAAGYNSQDPRAIVREYEEARSKVDHEFIDNYGGGDISYLMDKRAAGGTEAADLRYMSAKQAYYGLIDRAEDISRTAANARRRYYEFRRQGDNLISVQSKDGDAYHIIEGNYVTDPNTGKVLSSDPTVVVVDSEGNKIIVGVNTLLPSSLRIEKADEVIEQQAQLAAAQAYNSVMGAAQTPMQDEKQTAAKRLRPGDTVTLSIEGGPVTATVGEFENGRYTITTQDKITIGEQTGTTFHLAPDELSALLDNGSIEEVNNREQEEGQTPAPQQRETYHITDDDGDHSVEVVSRNEDGTIDIIFDGNPLITTQSQLQDLVDSSDEAAAARQEEQARAQAEAQAIAEEKAMPTREDGEPDYEKVSPERTLEYIENSGLEEQDIDNIIQNQLAQAQKTHKEASEAVQREFNSRPKAGTSIQAHKQALEDWNKRLDALRQQASDMYASVKYWNDVSALRQAKKQAAQRQKDTYAQQQAATPAEPTAVTPAAPVRPRRRGINPTSYRARLMAAGTPRSLRECIIYEIVDGIKFVWGSPKGGQTVMRNFRPVYVPEKRGIGDLLHWSKKEKEQYRWLLSEEGYTPETLAEAIKDGLFANYGYNYEDMDMTDIVAEIEDVLLSHDRRSAFLEEIEHSRRDEMDRYEEEGFYEMGYDGKADFEGEEAFYQSKILTEDQYRELITIFEDYYSQNDGHEQEQDLVGEDSQQGANPAAPDQGGGPAVDEAALRGSEPDAVPGVQGQDQGGSGVSQAPRHSVTPDRRGAGQNQGGLPGNTTDGDRQGTVRGSRGIDLSPEARAAQEVASTEAFKRESEAFHKGLEGSMILRADALAKILKERFPETADVMRVVTHTTLRDQLIRDNVDWIRAQSILSNVQENHSVGLLTRGFYVSGKVYLVADDLMSVEDAAEAFVHEHQHMTNSQQGLADKVLADGLDRAQASAAVATLAGTTYYSDHSNKDLADELIAHVIERAYRTGETIEEIAAAVGITNKKVIETLNSIYNDNRDINAATDAGRSSLLHRRNQPSDSRKNGADQEGRTREVGGQGNGSASPGQETGARYSVAEQVAQAREDVDTDPTDGQKKAGNYRMGHVTIDGYDITIENPKGSVRSGKDASGKAWSVTMNNDYGYIRRTEGVDGDHIDVFLSDHLDDWDGMVYVIDQVDPKTGEFDEHKVMYGFNSMEEARDNYLANYSKGWKGLGTITGVDSEEFRSWVDSSHRKTKAFYDYKSVNKSEGQSEARETQAETGSLADQEGYLNGEARYSVINDAVLAASLESGKKVKVYRAMQLIDGNLYPPMAGKINGKWQNPIILGRWEMADEHPELENSDGKHPDKFYLDKGNGDGIWAVYNPYLHTSRSPLNDQFSSAWKRPELVIVEVEVPESELTSGYKAAGAKNTVGETPWKSGPVGRILAKNGNPRMVILSRYDKPIRIVPAQEVAEKIAEMLAETDISIPFNTVNPELREALVAQGVAIGAPEKGNAGDASRESYDEWRDNVRFSIAATNKQFNDELQKQIDGTLPQGHIYKLGMPSRALLYAGIKDLPIEMSSSTLAVKSDKDYKSRHPYSLQEVRNLPLRLNYPIAVFDSESNDGRKVVLTELTDSKGNNFIGIIDVRKTKGRNIVSFNSVISMYPKESAGRVAKWFDSEFAKLTNKGEPTLLKWADIKKTSAWLANHASDVHAVGLSSRRIAKIVQKYSAVQGETENFSDNAHFSISAMDAAYMDAVNKGDMETAARMVRDAFKAAFPDTKVVDENGEPRVVKHGTPNSFTTFDEAMIGSHNDAGWLGTGFYFYGNNPEYAASYSARRGENGKMERGNVMDLFLNIRNPYYATREEFERLAEANDPAESIAFTEDRKQDGYDGVFYNGDLNEEWVAYDPNQIKSADPVTYDDNGSIIPLSQRFNKKSNDIRFSIGSFNPRLGVPKVRGGWTKTKILRYLKQNHANHGLSMASRLIAEFDSPGELKEHMFYHGTIYGTYDLKPSITMSESEVERIGGGGYGDRYWGISLSKSKKIASNFSGTSRSVRIFPVILAKNANVIERPDFSDAADLEDHIVELWEQGADAVWIGEGKQGKGEQELCVLNPKAIVVIEHPDFYQVYNLGQSENPLNIVDDQDIERIYQTALEYRERLRYRPRYNAHFPMFEDFGVWEEGISKEEHNKRMQAHNEAMQLYREGKRKFENSDEYKEWEKYTRKVDTTVRFSIASDPYLTDEAKAEVQSIKEATRIVSDITASNDKKYNPAEAEVDPLFSITRRNSETIDRLLSKKPDMTAEGIQAFKTYVEHEEPVAQLAMAKWVGNGSIRLPEDKPTVDEALKICRKEKLDPMAYSAPGNIVKEWRDKNLPEETEKRHYLSPDNYPNVLTNKRVVGDGITIYDVADTRDGQQAVRDLMNDHLTVDGRYYNCWCLLYASDSTGELTYDSWHTYWPSYNGVQKKVAFNKEGQIVAFCASHSSQDEWWDLSDRSHGEMIPIEGKIPGDRLGRSSMLEVDPKTGESTPVGDKYSGNRKNGLYRRWHGETLVESENNKGGKLHGLREKWNLKGQLILRVNYKNGMVDGLYESWHDNGQMYFRRNVKDGNPDGLNEIWYENGQMSERSNYKNGQEDGLFESWHENGQMSERAIFNNGLLEGVHERWDEGGQMILRANFKDGLKQGVYETWYGDGQKKSQFIYDRDIIKSGIEWYHSGTASFRNYTDEAGNNVVEHWDWRGQLVERKTFNNGIMVTEEWYDNGRKYRRIQNENGTPNGIQEVWNANGRMMSRGNYKDGKLDGLFESWYANGMKKDNHNYKNGKYDGLQEDWSPNGQLMRRINIKDDARNGLCEEWLSSGKIALRAIYKDGVMVKDLLLMHDDSFPAPMQDKSMRAPMQTKADKAPMFSVTEKSLIGVHNLSANKLRGAIKTGGLANPSMAVIDTNERMHTGYGEISLIPPASMIDATTGRNAGTYLGDAWTSTYPSVTKFLTKKGERHISEIASKAANGDSDVEYHIRHRLRDFVDGNGDRLHFLFLTQKGMNPEVVEKAVNHTHEEYETLRNLLGEGFWNESNPTDEQREAVLDLMLKEYEERKRREYGDRFKDETYKKMIDSYRKSIVNSDGKVQFAPYDSYLNDVARGERLRNNPERDWNRTDYAASVRVALEGLGQEYEEWKKSLFKEDDIEEKLFGGYTPSGERRYLDNTVENASRLMNREQDTNAYDNGGLSATRSVLLQKVRSLSEIRKNKDLLKNAEDQQEQYEELSNRLFDIIEKIAGKEKLSDNQFINIDYAESRLQDALSKRDPVAHLRREYNYDIEDDLAQQINDFIRDAKRMPVKYFETKFKRPVYLSEFAAAVVPNDTPSELIEALRNAGLDIKTYDDSSEETRDENRRQATMDAIRDRDDIRFSIIGETGARMLDIRKGSAQMMSALINAERMETFGYDKKAIRLATGWERGKDGLWRYEVDDVQLADESVIFGRPETDIEKEYRALEKEDSAVDASIHRLLRQFDAIPARGRTDEQKARVKSINKHLNAMYDRARAIREEKYKLEDELNQSRRTKQWRLDEIVKEGNPTLKAYPALGNTPVLYTGEIDDHFLGAVGQRGGVHVIVVNKNRVLTPDLFADVLRHELQHMVQKTEGFAQGGIDAQFDNDDEGYVDLKPYGLEGRVRPIDAYRLLAGEVEARNVSRRALMSPEERRQKLIEETEDVARRDQIVLRGETPNAFAEADRLSARPALDALAEASRITRETARKERAEYRAMFSVQGEGRMTVRERLAAALLDLSAGHEEDLRIQANAMTAVKGALEDVVKAVASAQKEYDQKTVSRVVRLARILIEGGMFDNSRRADIKRLIGLISETAGKKKIDSAVNAIVDQLLNRHLMNSNTLLEKLTTLKDTRTNAQGITVQGKLDLKGQRMLRTFREASGFDIEDIKDRIVDAANRMESADSVEAENAEIEYQALLLARRYREDIVARQSEEETLKSTLAKAERDHRNRLIDAATLANIRRTVAEGLRECRLERASAYLSIINDLDALVHDSMTAARAFRQAEAERIRRIHGVALRDVSGQPYSEQEGKKTAKDRIVNSWPVRLLFMPIATFDYMLRYFGKDSIDGRGHLWNEFMPRLQAAEDRLWAKTKQAMDTLDGKLTELFGKPMKWRDLYSMERRMPTVDVTYVNGDRLASMRLTQGQLLYLYMIYKMNDGRMKLNAMGVNNETMAQLTDAIDPRIKALGDWIQDVFLRDKREEYNEVYERLFGAPMADIQNYFPLVISGRARTKEEDLNDYQETTPSTITGNIIRRTRNSLPIDLKRANAFDVVIRHIESMEQWAAFAAINKDLNTLLSYNGFKNRVMDMSSVRFGARNRLYNNFRNTARIAAGVYHPATKIESLDSTMVNMAKGVTSAKISLRVNTAIKQLLSFPAFATSAAPWQLLSPKGAVESWNWAMENLPGFRKRWQSRQAGDSRLKETDADWGLWRNRIVETAQRIGMTPNAFIDGLTVAIGSYATYKTRYKGYIKDGYDEVDAKRKALLDASVVYNESQQSSVNAYLSAIQLDRTVAATAVTVFRNASMAYERNMVHSLAMAARYLDKDFREKAIHNAKKMMLQDGLSEEQASRAAQRRYNQALWKHLANVALYGFILQFFWDLGERYWYLLFGDDDDKKKEMLEENLLQSITGPIEGLTGGNAIAERIHYRMRGDKTQWTSPSLLPILSDMENIGRLMGYDKVAGMNEIVNLLIQMGIGVNPQTLTDMAVAVVDACQGDMGTAREAMILALRVINAPQSQIDELYIDELGGYGSELREMRLEDLAERYAAYKRHKSSPLTGWAYTDMDEWRAEQRYIKRFNEKVKARDEVSGKEDYDKAYATYKRKASEVDKMISDQEDRIDRARPDALKAAERISRVTASREYRVKQRVDECEKACEEIRKTYRDDKAMRDLMISLEREQAVRDIEEMD